jgi:hypothetical protein
VNFTYIRWFNETSSSYVKPSDASLFVEGDYDLRIEGTGWGVGNEHTLTLE